MNRYTESDIAAVYRVMRERRDMRHFLSDPVDADILIRIIEAAHLAPSVGMMQPWRFIRITDQVLRDSIHALVEEERLATAAALPSRNDEFLKVKIEGIKECAELLVVTLMPERDKHIIGRRTMADMDVA
ncbi:MAG: nitroreductase family protein, partial [Cycloclasticus sp.]|nr:nitroreductase family protein [Cycloclasticus sp.]